MDERTDSPERLHRRAAHLRVFADRLGREFVGAVAALGENFDERHTQRRFGLLHLCDDGLRHGLTGEAHEGGRRVVVEAPLGRPPVFSLGVDREDLREARDLHCPASLTLP